MSCSNWVTFTINDVCTVTDCLHKTAPSVDYVTPYKMLRTSNIRNGRIDTINVKYVTEDIYEEWTTRGKIQKDDVILTREAPMGEVGIIKSEENFFLGQRLLQLRANKEKITPDYLYYALQSSELQNQIKMQEGTGSVVSNIRIPLLKKFTITLPNDLEEQEKITKIIRCLDEKYELNNQINKTLEKISQSIFKQWFINFEFPNENGEPYKSNGGKLVESELGMIPEEWEIVTGTDMFNFYNGYSYKGKELGPSRDAMVTIKNFNRDGSYRVEGLKEIIISDRVKPHHFVKVGDVIVAHTDLTQNADIIGNPILIYSDANYKNLIISMDTVKVSSKYDYVSNHFIYLSILQN